MNKWLRVAIALLALATLLGWLFGRFTSDLTWLAWIIHSLQIFAFIVSALMIVALFIWALVGLITDS